MSIRQYRTRRFARSGASGRQLFALYLGWIGVIGLQISYPLVHGETLRIITLVTVYLAAAVMILHSYYAFGTRYTLTFATVTFAYALGIETLGVKTGWPFGRYHYSSTLGTQIFGVPLLVPFAWIMLTYPLIIAARRAAAHWVFLYGGIGLMIWDLFLDPQMVDAGRWTWKIVGPRVPYEPMIPLSNSAGWLFSGMGLMALLHLVLPRDRRKNSINSLAPDVLLFWSFLTGIIGNIFFFHHSHIAIFAGLLFGIYLLPYIFQLRFGRPETA